MLSRILFITITLIFSPALFAATVTVSGGGSPDTDGAYTINWTLSGDEANPVDLKENGIIIYSGNNTWSSLSGKSTGTYTYELFGDLPPAFPRGEPRYMKLGSVVVTVELEPVNQAPTITDITTQTINEDEDTGNIAFSIGDVETSASALTLTKSSSNTTLVPNGNIIFGGSGANRTVKVTPVTNLSGSATITVIVSDGTDTQSDTFTLTVNAVNDAPTVTNIVNQEINEGESTNVLSFTVEDEESPSAVLTVTASSNNTTLVPNNRITLSGVGASRTVLVNPMPDQFGTATITLAVSDEISTTNETFNVIVANVNDAPTITDIIDQPAFDEDSSSGSIGFTIGDSESAASSLILTASSNNTALVPVSSISFGGSGAARNVTVTPAPNQYGSAVITVTVSDGLLTASDSFSVTVDSVNDEPTISVIPNQTTSEDTPTSSISFTVDDVETNVNDLTLTKLSSTSLFPANNIVFGGSGANRTVTVTPLANASGSGEVTVWVGDGTSLVASIFTVTVTGTNDAPVITEGATHSITTAEDTAKTFTLNATDQEDDTLTWSIIKQGSNGTATAIGIGLSKSITYTPSLNFEGTDSFEVQVSDNNLTDVITVNVTVNAANDVPVITQGSTTSITLLEDNSQSITLNATDIENDTLTWSIANQATNGTATATGTGLSKSVSYTPDENFNGTDSFVVSVNDGSDADTITVSVTVTAVNDAPQITQGTNTSITVVEDVIKSFTLNATDQEDSVLTWTIQTPATLGIAVVTGTGNSKSISYTPNAETSGNDSFVIQVTDNVLTDSITVNVTINSVNDAPTITNITNRTINEDEDTGNVVFTIGDVETSTSALTLTKSSNNLTLIPSANITFGGSAANRTVKVTPAANQSGTATVTVTVSDNDLTQTDTFTVTVNAVNDAPTITSISNQTTSEGNATNIIPFTVEDEESASVVLTVTTSSSNTTLVPNNRITISGVGAARTVQVDPMPDQFGSTTITLTVSDDISDSVESFLVVVTDVNDAPTITSVSDQIIDEDQSTGALAFTISDSESSESALTLTATSTNTALVPASNITFGGSGASRTVSVNPVADQNGTTTITLTVSDGELTATDSFVVTVNSVNDNPTISVIPNQTINEDNSTGSISFIIGDEETSTSSLTLTKLSSTSLFPANNIVFGGSGANRTVTVTPLANASGSGEITVWVGDGTTLVSSIFTVTVNEVNDTPEITQGATTSITLDEDSSTTLALNATDQEDETLTWSIQTQATSGTATVSGTGASKVVTYSTNQDAEGSDSFVVQVSDGTSSATIIVSVTITGINDAPVITQGGSTAISVTNGAAKSLALNATDIENDALTWSIQTQGTLGTAVASGTGNSKTITYTPNESSTSTDTFSVQVSDGDLTDLITVTVTMSETNDAPVIIEGSTTNLTGTEDIVESHILNATDIDGDILTWSISTQAINGTAVASGTGDSKSISYTPNNDFEGSDSYIVEVSDGTLSDFITVSVTVIAVNDAPTIAQGESISLNTTEDTNGTLSLGATDIENDTITWSILTQGIKGSAVIDGTGQTNSVTYTPNTSETGADSFVVQISDGDLTDSITVNVDIAADGEEPQSEDWAEKSSMLIPDAATSAYTPGVNEAIGALSGEAGVSGGAANYSIPIALPPGRAGMQPSVSLNYSSRKGNGIAGVGWGLSVGSAISRCARTLAQDGRIGGVTYSETNDRICLNGQRLINVGNQEYRTEIDTFKKVKLIRGLNDSSARFKLITKGGIIQTFGWSDNSRVIPTGAPATLSWLIAKEQDQAGNTIEYKYIQNGDGEVLIDEVIYTGFGSQAGDRKVKFNYELREDRSSSYLLGGLTRQTQRLKNIQTYYGLTLIRQYSLSYDYSLASQKTLLKSVEECGYKNATAACLPVTTFDWQDKAIEYTVEKLGYKESLAGPIIPQLQDKVRINEVIPHGDVEGDGSVDWPTWSMDAEGVKTSGETNPLNTCHFNIYTHQYICVDADFNRDGKTDSWRESNGVLQIAYTPNVWTTTTNIELIDGAYPQQTADFNGDGWPDIVVYEHKKGYTAPELILYLHTGNPATPYLSNGQLIYTYDWTENGYLAPWSRVSYPNKESEAEFVGDMDGNGLPDFIHGRMNTVGGGVPHPIPTTVYLTKLDSSNNVYFEQVSLAGHAKPGINKEHFFTYFMDINGDGLTDWLSWQSDNINKINEISLSLNKGNSTFGDWNDLGPDAALAVRNYLVSIGADEPFDRNYPKYAESFRQFDINSDGKPELLMPGARLVEACASLRAFRIDGGSYQNTFCGDAMYGNIRTAGATQQKHEIPIWTADLDDSIYRWDAVYFDEQADGTYVARREATDIIGSATQNAPMSAFGNGLTDFVFTYGARFTTNVTIGSGAGTEVGNDYGVYVNRNSGTADPSGEERYKLIDTLKSVSNGMGNESRWTYRPLSSRDLDSTTHGPLYEVTDYVDSIDAFNFTSSMYVVAAYETSNGIGGFNQTDYRYKDAVYNYKGRGFQGFRTIVVDDSTGIRSVSDFKQDFPEAGQIESIRTCLIEDDPTCSEGNPISQVDVTTDYKTTANPDVFWVVATESIKTSYDLETRAQLSQQITTVGLNDTDQYGNVLESTVTIDNGFSNIEVSTVNNYIYDLTSWWINKLSYSQVTTKTLSGSAVYQSELDPIKQIKTNYTWTDNRQPDVVTVEPILGGGTTRFVDTDYNDYGLPTQVTTTANGESRSINTVYSNDGEIQSADGYFVFKVTNDLNQEVTTKTYPEHGQAKSITDLNGLTSSTFYDAFGRVEKVTPPAGTGQPAYSWFSSCVGGCDEVVAVSPMVLPIGDLASLITYKVTTGSAGSPETTLYKDKFNRVLVAKTQGFDGSSVFVRTEYDHLGRKLFESIPSFVVDEVKGVHFTEFDALSRLTKKRTDEPNNQFFTVSYGYSGHETLVQALGSRGKLIDMSRTHTGTGQLLKTVDDSGGVTEYAYDSQGNPIVLQDANGNPIKAEYNALGQKKYVIDPNMGRKDFTYLPFGEVDTEKDALNVITDYDYDILGRLVSRTVGGSLEATFTFDTGLRGGGGTCEGLPHQEEREDLSQGESFSRTYSYDSLCRPMASVTNIDGTNYQQSTQYDSYFGRVKGGETVSGVTVESLYNNYGYQTHSKNAANNYVYQQITDMDARLQMTTTHKANGILNEEFNYFEATGQMSSVHTDTLAGNQRHRIDYQYDDFGNLELQTVENFDKNSLSVIQSSENYLYDGLHRLLTATRDIDGTSEVNNYLYDAVGNFTKKDDYVAGNNGFSYGNVGRTAGGLAGPNGVRSINKVGGGTITYAYDANGNQLTSTGTDSTDNKTIIYNAFNKPVSIQKGNITSLFIYDANQMRYKQVKQGQTGGDETTIYIGKSYEEITYNGVTTKRQYIGDAIVTETVGGNDAGSKIGFVHRDRLNSVVTITDHNGNVVDNKSYDAFGKPRAGTMAAIPSASLKAVAAAGVTAIGSFELQTNRGFTDHEHMDDAELIHMNGRVYDYNLGRFLSVDPFIQEPGNSQSMNPYSYIMNNPLAGTDPSGYYFEKEQFKGLFTSIFPIRPKVCALEGGCEDNNGKEKGGGNSDSGNESPETIVPKKEVDYCSSCTEMQELILGTGELVEGSFWQSPILSEGDIVGYLALEDVREIRTLVAKGRTGEAAVVVALNLIPAGKLVKFFKNIGKVKTLLKNPKFLKELFRKRTVRSGNTNEFKNATSPVTNTGSVGAMKRLEFVASPKHGKSARNTAKGVSNPNPTNGQQALDNSLQVKGTSTRRVGVDKQNGEMVVFDQTSNGIFHGHVRSFKELTSQQQNTLRSAGMIDRKGNIL